MALSDLDEKAEAIAEEQGWGEETLLNLAHRFIEESELGPGYIKFLKKIAKEENS